jgi:hypothetical protein
VEFFVKIDSDLNIVIPIVDPVVAFSTPISEQVFEANYRILSETQALIFGKGMQKALLTGPRTAAMALSDVGRKLAEEEGADGDFGALALRAEIKRLTTILLPGQAGFEMAPVDAAIQSGKVDEGDWKEVEAQLVFFTCAYYLESRRQRKALIESIAGMLNCSTTSLNCGDYADSLKMSKRKENASEKAASSVPV